MLLCDLPNLTKVVCLIFLFFAQVIFLMCLMISLGLSSRGLKIFCVNGIEMLTVIL
uniref:Uncharacterized protein n=1 Tax=Arundo donax TaxID=35708 RepID=A0A0A8Y7X2_ARUDO